MRRSKNAGCGQTGSPAPRSGPSTPRSSPGNLPHERVTRLRQFWRELSKRAATRRLARPRPVGQIGSREFSVGRPAHRADAGRAATSRSFPPAELRALIAETVDFERINSGTVRVVFGAFNLATGAETFFDNDRHVLGPDHVLAGSPLPGLPPVAIDRAALRRQRRSGFGAGRCASGRYSVLRDRRL